MAAEPESAPSTTPDSPAAPGGVDFLDRRGVEAALVAAILLASVALHLWLIYSGRVHLDADECTLVLMGLDIQRGARPIFFYGQNYMGCVESYLYALWNVFVPSRSMMGVKAMALLLAIVYVLSCYGIVRRFVHKPAALMTLAFLALPSQLLGIWFLRVRGYLPWLLVGSAVIYQLLRLLEAGAPSPRRRDFALLGFTLGVGWWVNPLSIYYALTVAIALFAFKSLRQCVWPEILGSPRGAVATLLIVATSLILLSRTAIAPRKSEALQWMFEHRTLVFTLAAFALAGSAATLGRIREGKFFLAILTIGFLVGAAPQLFNSWTQEFLNLKPGLTDWENFWVYVKTAPYYVFPPMMGLIDVGDGAANFGTLVTVLIIGFYAIMLYHLFRRSIFEFTAIRLLWLLFGVALLFYLSQDGMPKTQPRQLLCLFFPLALGFSLFFLHLNSLARGLGWVMAALLILVNVLSYQPMSRRAVNARGNYDVEDRIVQYSLEKGFTEAYLDGDDSMANRMTFFTAKECIYIHTRTYFTRVPEHAERFRGRAEYPFITYDNPEYTDWLGRPADTVIGRFAIFDSVDRDELAERFPNADGLN